MHHLTSSQSIPVKECLCENLYFPGHMCNCSRGKQLPVLSERAEISIVGIVKFQLHSTDMNFHIFAIFRGMCNVFRVKWQFPTAKSPDFMKNLKQDQKYLPLSQNMTDVSLSTERFHYFWQIAYLNLKNSKNILLK